MGNLRSLLLFVLLAVGLLAFMFWMEGQLDHPLWDNRWIFLGYQAIATVVWVLSGLLGIKLLNRSLVPFWVHRSGGRIAPALLRTLVAVVISLLVLSAVMGLVYRQTITGLWAMSGGIGLVVAFALQNVFGDFFAGVVTNAEGVFKIGDAIQLNDNRLSSQPIQGKVLDVNWHSIKIKTPANNLVVIPNRLFTQMIVTNLSAPSPERSLVVSLRFDLAESTERIRRVLEAAALLTQEVCRFPGPQVLLNGIDHLGQEYQVEVWFEQGRFREKDVRSALMYKLQRQIQQSGLKLAYPQSDFYLHKTPKVSLDHLSELVALLGRVDLFGVLNASDLNLLAANLKSVSGRTGEKIVTQGEPGDSMYLLREGLVEVEVEGQGVKAQVAKLGSGDYFGEMSLFSGDQRKATVTCRTDCLFFEITKETMTYLLERNPSLSRRLFVELARREAVNQAAMARKKGEQLAAPLEVEETTFRRIKNYFSSLTDSMFLVDSETLDQLSAAGNSHLGLVAPKVGIASQHEMAVCSVVLGVSSQQPGKYSVQKPLEER